MASMTWLRLCVLVAVLIRTVAGASPLLALEVGPGASLLAPNLIQLSGYVTQAPADAATIGSVTLGLPDGETLLILSKVQVRNNGLTEGTSALRGVQLYKPNLRLVGDVELLRAIGSAAPQTQLTVFGYLNVGSRRLFVVAVEPA